MIQTIGIVSLSRGILGEDFLHHELDLGLGRLKDFGVRVKFLPTRWTVWNHSPRTPSTARKTCWTRSATRRSTQFSAPSAETTRTGSPHIFFQRRAQNAVTKKPFLGFSDTTLNHFMLHKVGLPTFYGQAFLPDNVRACACDASLHSGILRNS